MSGKSEIEQHFTILLKNIRLQTDIFFIFDYQIIIMENCLECGERIIGRSDKKFCNDGCRNAYNNKNNKDSTNLMRSINNKLRKNYRILCEMNPEGKTKTTKQRLLSNGFDFEYFTQLVTYKNNSEYRFVYEQGYKFLEDGWILLVKKD